MTDKIIDLIATGYVSCIAGDIGKQVKDDTVEIGLLQGYNNTTRKWWVTTDSIVVIGSVMSITAGTGAGVSTSSEPAYCTINQIKGRLLITTADTTYDTELKTAGDEAGYLIDERLRPHLTYAQNVTLNLASYADCESGDIGKEVMNDEVKIGILLDYNNTSRVWKIKTASTVAIASVLKISDGYGSGVATGASTDAVTEQTNPYFIFKTLPLSATIPLPVKEIAADLGAGLFKRRQMPQDLDSGWFGQGLKKLEEFIKSNFFKGTINLV